MPQRIAKSSSKYAPKTQWKQNTQLIYSQYSMITNYCIKFTEKPKYREMEIRNEQPTWISTSHKKLRNSQRKKIIKYPQNLTPSHKPKWWVASNCKVPLCSELGLTTRPGDRCPGLVEEAYLPYQKPRTCLTLTWLEGSKSAGTRSVTVHWAALTPGLDTDTHHSSASDRRPPLAATTHDLPVITVQRSVAVILCSALAEPDCIWWVMLPRTERGRGWGLWGLLEYWFVGRLHLLGIGLHSLWWVWEKQWTIRGETGAVKRMK